MNLYSRIVPLVKPIPATRQAAKRHYGTHPYFTRRPYNVVREYILHYSKEGDRVMDPFGGSGVTAIEAFIENRIGIHNDINPLANFIAQGIVNLHKGLISEYKNALQCIEQRCMQTLSQISQLDEKKLQAFKRKVKLPENAILPKTSDVGRYYELFSLRQLLSLAVLKDAIEKLPNNYAQKGMFLAWSATLSKLNKTFLSAEGRAESRGGSSIFSIYRYKVAKKPIELPAWEMFYERAVNILEAKEEIDKAVELKKRTGGWSGEFQIHCKDIEELSRQHKGQIDYIFTDPPYGGHISYLDLSTLWNVWLGLSPDARTREKELIVGGELNLSEKQYIDRLSNSIRACVSMLKKDRWLSVVFQHWNASYFEAILSSATESGAELKAAISQIGDPIWSMHKKKNTNSVLAGELILTFYKSGHAGTVVKDKKLDVAEIVKEILDAMREDHIYGEYLFNKLIIEAWKRSAIGSLNISKTDFTSMLENFGWHYDDRNHYWVRKEHRQRELFPMEE